MCMAGFFAPTYPVSNLAVLSHFAYSYYFRLDKEVGHPNFLHIREFVVLTEFFWGLFLNYFTHLALKSLTYHLDSYPTI